ncbi:hypothetical protein QEH68_11945 [Paenarthrobacter sp. OM7]|uniref:hypothetical protein n=1 Tax=Paenarthrobacter sp. OM7 TaxID=3041264 RepID=UPI00246893C5|nr:hypothetical protein [Paenarthrobacter sp. OM7]WGM18770.1 hypothetical protein QEH68_11945 [Paenarthrobacter sp. OM7]
MKLTAGQVLGNQYSAAWTKALRSVVDINDLSSVDAGTLQCLREMASVQSAYAKMDSPVIFNSGIAEADLRLLSDICAEGMSIETRQNASGKKNARIAPQYAEFVGRLGLQQRAVEATGLPLTATDGAVFIIYDEPQAGLGLHLDLTSFGGLTMLLCIERRVTSDSSSATVAVTPDGIDEYRYGVGECLIFDGTRTIHGRTPVGDGEKIVLLSVGFEYASSEEAQS